jgi:hypothetical protein
VDFLSQVAAKSKRPKSIVFGTVSALQALYSALEHNPITPEVRLVADGIVKCRTIVPMQQTPVMPIQPFIDLFSSWPDNDSLSVKQLRMKAICLMALVFMLRPSDIAPRSQVMNESAASHHDAVFSTSHLDFMPDGSLTVRFHGIKNDYDRDGFSVTIPHLPGQFDKCDPVLSLQAYIEATKQFRRSLPSSPVFLTLNKPYRAIDASTVSSVLSESIKLAGLSSHQYSPRSFRPTGATQAINCGIHPDIARHIGRWRSQDTFNKHYVHTKVPDSYTQNILFSHIDS